jgi:hypothetical protein
MPSGNKKQRAEGFVKGNWFASAGYWLFPLNLLDEHSEYLNERAIGLEINRRRCSEPQATKVATKIEAETETEELKKNCGVLFKSFEERYNSQPVWHLKDIASGSGDEARCAVSEFLEMVNITSAEFVWPINDPEEGCHWRAHGWKHVTYSALKMFWEGHLYEFEPAVNRAVALGSPDEIRELFLAASKRDPEAVGIIWTQFPRKEDQREIIDNYITFNARACRIPHPSDLATEFVDSIFECPDSDEADKARDKLLKLVALSVRRGSRSRRGRPKIRIPRESLRLLWKMGYCLVLQVLELNDFLNRQEKLKRDRRTILLTAYPWVNRFARSFDDFISLGASRAALEIVGKLAELSPSSLEKMGLRSRS